MTEMIPPTDETKPRREDLFPPEPDERDGDPDGDPGCLIWGLVGFLGIFLAVAIVLTAAFAGFSKGLSAARITATLVRFSNVMSQCEQIPTDIAAGRMMLVQSRFDDLAQNGAIPACAQPYIQIATQAYQSSLITPTTMPVAASPTLPATAIPAVTDVPPSIVPTSASGYDLTGLLQEARDEIAIDDYEEAIRTLEAILAIDPAFERNAVNNLLYNALTARATSLYRGDGSLAEAIQLTNRAEQYGDVESLAFERTVAQYYLDAQGFLGVNYPAAIQQLNLVRGFAPNYRDVNQLLVAQYAGYAEAFMAGAEPCRAVNQLDAALALIPQPNLQVRRDEAQALCSGLPTPVSSGTGIAPIGQSGG